MNEEAPKAKTMETPQEETKEERKGTPKTHQTKA
jgi:hypothetical protein